MALKGKILYIYWKLIDNQQGMPYNTVRTPPPPHPLTPPWVMWGKRAVSHFPECLYRSDLGEIGILGGNWHFRLGWWLENSLYKKYWIQISSKKNDSECNFYNFSLLIPCTNKFVVVLFVSLFSMVYTPSYPQFFFCGRLNFFLCLV